MGTRHLIKVVSGGKTKVAQYGQWDGYRAGQGLTILDFLRERNLDTFRRKLDNVRWMTEEDHEEVNKFLAEIGVHDGWMNWDQSEKYQARFPELHRNTGADILELIFNNERQIFLHDSSDFEKNDLYCEFCYTIDLDNRTLQVSDTNEAYSFDNLPTDEEFCAIENQEDG